MFVELVSSTSPDELDVTMPKSKMYGSTSAAISLEDLLNDDPVMDQDSGYTSFCAPTDSETNRSTYNYRENVGNRVSTSDRHSSPVVVCKPEKDKLLDEVYTMGSYNELTRSDVDVLYTQSRETTVGSVSSVTEKFKYAEPQGKKLAASPESEHRSGTPVFPPATESDQVTVTGSSSTNGLASDKSPVLQSFGSHDTSGAIAQTDQADLENSADGVQTEHSFAVSQLVNNYTGLGGGVAHGYWTQPAVIAQSEQMNSPYPYSVPIPTANAYGTCQGYKSTTPTIAAPWPWMVAVGQNLGPYPANLGEVVQTVDPRLSQALSVPILQPTVDVLTPQYSENCGASFPLNSVTDGDRPSAFHVVSRDPDVTIISALHRPAAVSQEVTASTADEQLTTECNSGPRTRRTSTRLSSKQARIRLNSLEGILNESTNSSSGYELSQESTSEKECRHSWSSSVGETYPIEPSCVDSEYSQPTSSTKSCELTSLRSRPLNRNALRQMKQWYEAHIDRPYPTTAEKLQLAKLGGIKLSQVNSWFANQRTRSCNTRPKKRLQRLHLRLKDVAVELEQITQGIVSAADLEVRLRNIVNEYLS